MKYRLILAACLSICGHAAMAMDVAQYNALADLTIKQAATGVAGDIDAMIARQERLVRLGIEGSLQYLRSNPKDAAALRLTVQNAKNMMSMTLDEIEELWHQGKYLLSRGIDPEKIDHFGPLMSLMDSIIHPATSYLALKAYKQSGDPDLLARARAELIEVVEHVRHIQPMDTATAGLH